jgi:hypothetical protein
VHLSCTAHHENATDASTSSRAVHWRDSSMKCQALRRFPRLLWCCAALVIPLPSTHVVVLAVDTLADFCAEDATLEALAVLLEAGALLAVAALCVPDAAIRCIAHALRVRVTVRSLNTASTTSSSNSISVRNIPCSLQDLHTWWHHQQGELAQRI